MIVSYKYNYLFIEIPLTGSWAIRNELCTYYDGEPILHKHASFPEFQRIHSGDAQSFFVFATVRHPLDKTVSQYVKLRDNHRGAYSAPDSPEELVIDYADRGKHRFARREDTTFSAYLRRYHRRAYTEIIEVSRPHLDSVIRFEKLQEGFSEVLRRLGIEQVRPIPVRNRTEGKKRDWREYYEPDVIPQVKGVFGPFMKSWQYEFPEEWGGYSHSRQREVEFRVRRFLANQYLIHFRYSYGRAARGVKKVRALLKG